MSAKADWPAGVARHVLATVDSTNSHAMRMAPQLVGPAWFLGLQQSAGRGRRGRPWVSPLGNFYATLLMQVQEPAEVVALRSFVAALALRDAFVMLTKLPDAFALKWPNDVLLNGGKVAGILLESTLGARGIDLCVGIGVNLIAAPKAAVVEAGALPPVSLLAETGVRIAPEAFLEALGIAFGRWEAIFVTSGFAPVRTEWLAHAARLGEVIRARTGDQTREGVFETIDGAGNLMLRMARETVAIPAAEVFF